MARPNRCDEYLRFIAYIEDGGVPRRTGRSFRLAILYIMQAWNHPESVVEIRDHINNRASHGYLFDKVREILHALDLQGFTMNRTNKTIMFNGYTFRSVDEG